MSAHSFNHSPTPRASSLHFMRGKSRSQIHPFALLPPHCYIIQWHQLRCTKQIFFHLFMLPQSGTNCGHTKESRMAPKWSTLITVKETDWNCCSTISFIILFRLENFRGWRCANKLEFRRSEAETSEWRVNMLILTCMECRVYYNFSEMLKHENPNRLFPKPHTVFTQLDTNLRSYLPFLQNSRPNTLPLTKGPFP